MKDISVNVNGYRVELRVAAFVARGEDVLVCRVRGKDWWFLPEGRIKANESSLAALKRQICEEIGGSFQIVRPALCSENFFKLDGHRFHEICIYHEVQWLADKVLEQQTGAKEVFDWIARKDVSKIDLRPDFIREHIINPGPHLELVIYRDGETSATADAGKRRR